MLDDVNLNVIFSTPGSLKSFMETTVLSRTNNTEEFVPVKKPQ